MNRVFLGYRHLCAVSSDVSREPDECQLNLETEDGDLVVHLGFRRHGRVVAVNARRRGEWGAETLLINPAPDDQDTFGVCVEILPRRFVLRLGDVLVAEFPLSRHGDWDVQAQDIRIITGDLPPETLRLTARDDVADGRTHPVRGETRDDGPAQRAALIKILAPGAPAGGDPLEAAAYDAVRLVRHDPAKPAQTAVAMIATLAGVDAHTLTVVCQVAPSHAEGDAGGPHALTPERVITYAGTGGLGFDAPWRLTLRGENARGLAVTAAGLTLDPAAEARSVWRVSGGEEATDWARARASAPILAAENAGAADPRRRQRVWREAILVAGEGGDGAGLTRPSRHVFRDPFGARVEGGDAIHNAQADALRAAAAVLSAHLVDAVVIVRADVADRPGLSAALDVMASEGPLTFGEADGRLVALRVARSALIDDPTRGRAHWTYCDLGDLDGEGEDGSALTHALRDRAPALALGPLDDAEAVSALQAAVATVSRDQLDALARYVRPRLDHFLVTDPIVTIDAVSDLDLRSGGRRLAEVVDRLVARAAAFSSRDLIDVILHLCHLKHTGLAGVLIEAVDGRELEAADRYRLAGARLNVALRGPEDRDVNRNTLLGEMPNDAASDPGALAQFLRVMAEDEDWAQIVAATDDVPRHAMTEDLFVYRGAALLQTARLDALHRLLSQNLAEKGLVTWNARRMRAELAYAVGDHAMARNEVDALISTYDVLDGLRAPQADVRGPYNTAPKVAEDEVSCVIVARNEYLRLAWLIDYYRSIGVSHFFLIDNGSTDETLDAFAKADDVHIFTTEERYSQAQYGVRWHNHICDALLRDRWVLTVDADEALVFRGQGERSVRDLCRELDEEGYEGIMTPMVDMYADAPLSAVTYDVGMSLIETFPYFDARGYDRFVLAGSPNMGVNGGVRRRVFCGDGHNRSIAPIAMQKVALTKWSNDRRYLLSTHDMSPTRVSPARRDAALLHFKFLSDFHRRAQVEVRRAEHYDGAREYKRYLEFLAIHGDRPFIYEHSQRFESFESLDAITFRDNPY